MKIVRLLVYEGPEKWLLHTLSQNVIKRVSHFGADKTITSIELGTMPDDIDVYLKGELPDGD